MRREVHSETAPDLLALDFDGVLCDGLREYFHTSWRVYCRVWKERKTHPDQGLRDWFYRLRPVIESGWEMPLLIRALMLGYGEDELYAQWAQITQRILSEDGLTSSLLGEQFNADRDEQIQSDEGAWLALHRFYPGVIRRIHSVLQGPTPFRIITTKEERYARRLLERQGVHLAEDSIVGRGQRRSKAETLLGYLNELGTAARIWFVEDRLSTLQLVRAHAGLDTLRLFLADWGYNTPAERQSAGSEDAIQRLSLEQFCDDFAKW